MSRYEPGHFDGDGCTFPDPGHFAADPFVHWGDESARPTSVHGNGAASFERVTLDLAEVTCGLCHYVLSRSEHVTPPGQ